MTKTKSILILVVVFVVSTLLSYWFFLGSTLNLQKQVVKPHIPNSNGALSFDDTKPKTESCPLNGALYSKDQRQWWETHRPLGIMVENHENSRPQSGIIGADVVDEVISEGGITRFLTIFYCRDAGQVGPIRSARTYFLDIISEYGDSPLYVHVGGANTDGPANALGQIEQYGWVGYNDINQFSVGFPTFWRDYDRLGHETATEHTMYSTTKKLWDLAKLRGLTNVDKKGNPWDGKFVPYSFKDDASPTQRGNPQTIHLEFWKNYSNYFVDWIYDKEANIYKRNNGGKQHIDRDNNKQITVKNIVVLFMQENSANDGYENNLHLLYKTKGIGRATIFMDGQKITGTWRKETRTSRMQIFDSAGLPVKFDRGVLWFDILPIDGVATVQ